MNNKQIPEKAIYTECTDGKLHQFVPIRDDGKKKEIRKHFPDCTFMLWECVKCKKFVETI